MSEDQNKNSYPYNSFRNMGSEGFSFPFITDYNTQNYNPSVYTQHLSSPLQNPTDFLSFQSCLHGVGDQYNNLSTAFDSSSDQAAIYTVNNDTNDLNEVIRESDVGTCSTAAAENPPTPNSSVSLSSSEVGVEEDSCKIKKDLQTDEDMGDGKTKNVTGKKKGEKKKREPRFAFMTKSEADNLEDGYRWRKYGQKAVKNSPFPRSYYRCTSQKCNVKKRIERSFEDPSVVITTYEGQHNHHSPATLRGSAAAMLGPSLFTPAPAFTTSFPQDHLFNIPSTNTQQNHHSSTFYTNLMNPVQQPQVLPDRYSPSPDLFSSFLHKPQP